MWIRRRPAAIGQRQFEQLVEEAVLSIPDPFAAKLDNVEIVVEDEPDPDTIERMKIERGRVLLGLYHGVPRIERHATAPPLYPDTITIYRRPILAVCRTAGDTRRLADEIRTQVRQTVIHEIGHHFGLSDADMRSG